MTRRPAPVVLPGFTLTGTGGEHPAPDAVWVPAAVPGGVHEALVDAGLLQHPWTTDDDADSAWVEHRTWWFRTTVQVPPAVAGTRTLLRFEGLDGVATCWLDGALLGEHANQHRPCELAVPASAHGREVELLLRFVPPLDGLLSDDELTARLQALTERQRRLRPRAEPPRAQDLALRLQRVRRRKAACSWGWDLGPRLPSVGLHLPALLVQEPDARLAGVHARTTALDVGAATAELTVAVEATTADAGVDLVLTDPAGVVVASWSGSAGAGDAVLPVIGAAAVVAARPRRLAPVPAAHPAAPRRRRARRAHRPAGPADGRPRPLSRSRRRPPVPVRRQRGAGLRARRELGAGVAAGRVRPGGAVPRAGGGRAARADDGAAGVGRRPVRVRRLLRRLRRARRARLAGLRVRLRRLPQRRRGAHRGGPGRGGLPGAAAAQPAEPAAVGRQQRGAGHPRDRHRRHRPRPVGLDVVPRAAARRRRDAQPGRPLLAGQPVGAGPGRDRQRRARRRPARVGGVARRRRRGRHARGLPDAGARRAPAPLRPRHRPVHQRVRDPRRARPVRRSSAGARARWRWAAPRWPTATRTPPATRPGR